MPKLACAGLPTDRRSPSIWASLFPSRIPIIALFMQRSIDAARRAVELMPNARLHEMNAGHLPFLDDPTECGRIVKEFFFHKVSNLNRGRETGGNLFIPAILRANSFHAKAG